jgi:hypothetical protein
MEDILTHPFPMIRAGGAFLVVAGVLFGIGWMLPKLFGLFMSLAFGIGFMTAWAVLQIEPDLGPVRWLDVAALALAFALEAVALVWMYRVVKDERRSDAWVLILVGLHFLPMVVLLGPLSLVLVTLTVANGWAALLATRVSILPFGLIDSAIKIGIGVWLFVGYPRWGDVFSLDGLGLGTVGS